MLLPAEIPPPRSPSHEEMQMGFLEEASHKWIYGLFTYIGDSVFYLASYPSSLIIVQWCRDGKKSLVSIVNLHVRFPENSMDCKLSVFLHKWWRNSRMCTVYSTDIVYSEETMPALRNLPTLFAILCCSYECQIWSIVRSKLFTPFTTKMMPFFANWPRLFVIKSFLPFLMAYLVVRRDVEPGSLQTLHRVFVGER